jgi:PEP-CTERM putative exosortase interaction domain
MVFVLDTSGSMSGRPLAACQAFMQKALQTLRPNDYFRIVTFDNAAREFSSGAVPADPDRIKQGLAYVKQLRAGGGTEAAAGIRQALSPPQPPDTLRLVVFMTDGYIGNEAQVLRLTNELIGRARILSFGVGTSVNRYLLEELAREGRGWCQILDPTADADEVTAALAGRLEAPVLTDISIDWGGQVTEVAPDPVPDLFAGQSVRIMGRYERGGPREVLVSGLSGGRRARMPIKIDLPLQADSPGAQAIPLIWARENIAELSRQFNRPPSLTSVNLDELKERITVMGLTYNLVTTWTSFVAVSKQVVNQSVKATDAQVPLPQVAGVEAEAYGLSSRSNQVAMAAPARATNSGGGSSGSSTGSWAGFSFSGGATPEPATMGGLALMAAAGWAALKRRRKR